MFYVNTSRSISIVFFRVFYIFVYTRDCHRPLRPTGGSAIFWFLKFVLKSCETYEVQVQWGVVYKKYDVKKDRI